MKRTMNCDQFAQNLDRYLDGELDQAPQAAFLEHARACAGCEEKLKVATALAELCAGLGDEVAVPLELQASWRRAVRAQAAGKVKPRSITVRRVVRGLGAAAAALLVLVGASMMFSNQGELGIDTSVKQKLIATAPRAVNTSGSYSGGTGMIQLSDGAMDEEQVVDVYDDDDDSYSASVVPESESGFDPSATEATIKEIRTASRSIETSNFDSDMQAVRELIEEYDGRVDNENVYGTPMQPGETRGRNAYLNARVSTAELDTFLTALNAVGTVTARSESREEITKQYYDTQARLTNQTLLRTKLQNMVPQAQTTSELIEIERELANVQSNIDSMNSRIGTWDAQIEFSTVQISISEVADPKELKPIDSASLMERLQVGFAESINMFSGFMQNVLVYAVMFWPWIVIGLIVIVVVHSSVRRRRRI